MGKRMHKKLLIVGLTALLLSVCQVYSSQASENKYRLGLQGTQFAAGLSGIIDFSSPWAVQGIVDFGADAAALRLLNRFTEKKYWNVYGQATLGVWGQDSPRSWGWSEDDYLKHHEGGFGAGIGLGIEYDWRGIEASLPPIGWNLELGASVIPAFYFDIGIGVHWMF